MFKPWELGMIDEAGYNGIRDVHIEKIVDSMISDGISELDSSTIEYYCHKCGIDPDNFTDDDLESLEDEFRSRK